MKRAFFFTILSVGLVFAISGSLAANSDTVAGEWDVVYNTPGGPRPFKLVLSVDGEKLTGTAKRPNGDVPVEGTIKGDVITFAYTINYGGNALTLSFSGKVTGDKMAGSVIIGSTQEDWSATRAK
ncbi:MAG: hypothetical protein IPM50_03790 [Acidobacteriota bacterium]|nr:MAG: hypothetical protein IPM50_03790 [Acidobacteriota bacterium]